MYGNGHICSGALISNFTILTVASCLKDKNGKAYDADELTIAFGNLYLYQQTDDTLNIKVQRIKRHKNYNSVTNANDVAFLEVCIINASNSNTINSINLLNSFN